MESAEIGKSGQRAATRRVRILELALDGYKSGQIAEKVQCSPRTVRYHLQHSQAELSRLRDERFRALSDRSVLVADSAILVLAAILRDETAPPGARVSACARVLEAAIHLAEVVDLTERVAELERRLGEGKV